MAVKKVAINEESVYTRQANWTGDDDKEAVAGLRDIRRYKSNPYKDAASKIVEDAIDRALVAQCRRQLGLADSKANRKTSYSTDYLGRLELLAAAITATVVEAATVEYLQINLGIVRLDKKASFYSSRLLIDLAAKLSSEALAAAVQQVTYKEICVPIPRSASLARLAGNKSGKPASPKQKRSPVSTPPVKVSRSTSRVSLGNVPTSGKTTRSQSINKLQRSASDKLHGSGSCVKLRPTKSDELHGTCKVGDLQHPDPGIDLKKALDVDETIDAVVDVISGKEESSLENDGDEETEDEEEGKKIAERSERYLNDLAAKITRMAIELALNRERSRGFSKNEVLPEIPRQSSSLKLITSPRSMSVHRSMPAIDDTISQIQINYSPGLKKFSLVPPIGVPCGKSRHFDEPITDCGDNPRCLQAPAHFMPEFHSPAMQSLSTKKHTKTRDAYVYKSFPGLSKLPRARFNRLPGYKRTFAKKRDVFTDFVCPRAPNYSHKDLMVNSNYVLKKHYDKTDCSQFNHWEKL